MCAVSMLVGAPHNCSRFVCRYDFHEDVLDSVYVPIFMYCCTLIQYIALAIILSSSGERMHRDNVPPQRMHAACRIVTLGSCSAKRFAEFNGNCESYCSLEQLVASLSVADEGNWKICCRYASSEDRRLLHQKTLVQTTRLTLLWGVHLD